MTDELSKLEHAIGHLFKDRDLLQKALTHASVTTSQRERISSNERLEFLGDRVLGLVIAKLLYIQFSGEEEGALSRRFTALVRMEALARVGANIGLGAYLDMSRGENDSGGRENPALLADACEALIAAMYLDGGLDVAQGFILTHWADLLKEDPTPPKDPKTALQEWAQGKNLGLPVYATLERTGPSHAPSFVIAAQISGLPDQSGQGTSKQKAGQAAAQAMLDYIASHAANGVIQS